MCGRPSLESVDVKLCARSSTGKLVSGSLTQATRPCATLGFRRGSLTQVTRTDPECFALFGQAPPVGPGFPPGGVPYPGNSPRKPPAPPQEKFLTQVTLRERPLAAPRCAGAPLSSLFDVKLCARGSYVLGAALRRDRLRRTPRRRHLHRRSEGRAASGTAAPSCDAASGTAAPSCDPAFRVGVPLQVSPRVVHKPSLKGVGLPAELEHRGEGLPLGMMFGTEPRP